MRAKPRRAELVTFGSTLNLAAQVMLGEALFLRGPRSSSAKERRLHAEILVKVARAIDELSSACRRGV